MTIDQHTQHHIVSYKKLVGIWLALLALTVVRNQAEPVGPINALQLGGILIALGIAVYFVAVRFSERARGVTAG